MESKRVKIRKHRVLWEHQKRMLFYCMIVKNPALFVDMRLGKTLVIIRYFEMQSDIKRVLIVAPYSAFPAWQNDLWIEGLEVTEVAGTWAQRRSRLPYNNIGGTKYYLTNKEGFLTIPEISTYVDWDAVVLDESTFVKNPKAQVSKYFTMHFKDTKYKAILSGMPAPESSLEYYQQLYFLNPNILGVKNYWEFRNDYFIQGDNYSFTLSQWGEQELTRKLKKHCYFLKRSDVKGGEIKVHSQRVIELSCTAREVYDTISKEFIIEYKEVSKKTKYAMTAFNWLCQLCGGFVNGKFEFNDKLNELKSLLSNELKGESVVLVANYTQELKMLKRELKKKYKVGLVYGNILPNKRPVIYSSFMRKEIQILIAQPVCISHGLDLSVSDTIIFYSTTLSLETRTQVEDRIMAFSKSRRGLVIDIICNNTIEQRIMYLLFRKGVKEDIIKRIVKEMQRKEMGE